MSAAANSDSGVLVSVTRDSPNAEPSANDAATSCERLVFDGEAIPRITTFTSIEAPRSPISKACGESTPKVQSFSNRADYLWAFASDL